MRKIVLAISAVVLLAVSSMPVYAEDSASSKHHIELSFSDGGASLIDRRLVEGESISLWRGSMYDYAEKSGFDIRDMGYIIPSVTLGYYYQVLPWLQVGGQISTGTCSLINLYTPNTRDRIGSYYNQGIYITAGVRFTYFQTDFVQLYSGLSLGARMNIHSRMLPDPYSSVGANVESSSFTFQATAFGVRFGKKVYGFAELGYGYNGILKVGIGTRF